jgi:DNA-directed RNA polymerase specialized sigma24 family protein
MSVRQAMLALSDDCREILDRFFAQDQSYADISRALDVPMGTIASRISRCLTKLRTTLED